MSKDIPHGGPVQWGWFTYGDELELKGDMQEANFKRIIKSVSIGGERKYVGALNYDVIPGLGDQDRYADSLVPMDMIFQGISMSLFHAKQQWSRMSL
jgi:hypothetical protein